MSTTKIYIASSWKNQHGVQMLTYWLRELNFDVISWIENNYEENPDSADNTKKFDFEEWVNTENAERCFDFDTFGAMNCDIFIYYGPAGKDAAAECGLCYSKREHRFIPMFGLWAKSEDFGLMRKMFDRWFCQTSELVKACIDFREEGVNSLK